ncbi:MAG: SIS domain-containing protein, partial [Clostridia bacterium]|nr:SIS domain-containing protein [Clostridia bacterium]
MDYIKDTVRRYPMLSDCREDMEKTVDIICGMHKGGGKLLLCGNGGSSSDCEHISGELLKGFIKKRPYKKGE